MVEWGDPSAPPLLIAHGGFDFAETLNVFAPLLVAAGSGLLTLGIPSTPGVTKGAAGDTIVLPYNDLDAVAEAFAANPGRIAWLPMMAPESM